MQDTVVAAESRYRIGAWVGLASIVMLFTSLSSAFIVRSASPFDWLPLAPPRVLFGSTALILLSSASLEFARRRLKQSLHDAYTRYLLLTILLGLAFLTSQLIAWRQLRQQGIYLATHPFSSFFYLLTGAHAISVVSFARTNRIIGRACQASGKSGCGGDLLAFPGRSLDLLISTSISLEVTRGG